MSTIHVPRLSLIRAGLPTSSADVATVSGVNGTKLAQVDQAPPLLAVMTVTGLRDAGPAQAPSPETLRVAGDLFATGQCNGLDARSYCELHARCSGIPITVARRSLDAIRVACEQAAQRLEAERPPGAAQGRPPGTIGAVWARRGDVLAVIAPSNAPEVHSYWIQALLLGYRIVICPGARDPFTPARLVAALIGAGVEPASLSLLPGGHATGEALIEAADLSIVFGNDATVNRYATEPTVLARGPGRSKVLHTGKITDTALEVICDSVAYDGGLRCTNATAVFTEADPSELADAVAARLAGLTAAPPQCDEAELPVMPTGSARSLRESLTARLAGAADVSARYYADGPVADLGDGSAALRPAVLCCDRVDHPGTGIEQPFPCVWIAPWSCRDSTAPLRGSLALTVLSDDTELARQALAEPSIRKVLLGPIPTYAAGSISPHDGYLSHDLMEARAYGVAAGTAFVELPTLRPVELPADRDKAADRLLGR